MVSVYLCQNSDIYSGSLSMSDASSRLFHSHSSPSTPLTSTSPKTLVLPPSIPEHREVSSVGGVDQQQSSASSSPARVPVTWRRTSLALPPGQSTDETSECVTNSVERRRSVPAVITPDRRRIQGTLAEDLNVAKARRHNQLRITEMLSNFPKV